MDRPPVSSHSPLQALDLNRPSQRRPRPDKPWNARGKSPHDVMRGGETFAYAPSGTPLSIERGERIQRPQKPTLEARTQRGMGPVSSSFSPSSASSYGSVIGSGWYAGQGGVAWNAGQGSSRGSGSRHALPTDENDYAASRLAITSTNGQNTGLSLAPRMQRQLSGRSNDGFLFSAEDMDFNPEPTTVYTPSGSAPTHTVVPKPFPWHLQEEEAASFAKRRVSGEKGASGLDSPWKSPGWKVREREEAGSRVRERAGSLLGMTVEEEENEIPRVSPAVRVILGFG